MFTLFTHMHMTLHMEKAKLRLKPRLEDDVLARHPYLDLNVIVFFYQALMDFTYLTDMFNQS